MDTIEKASRRAAEFLGLPWSKDKQLLLIKAFRGIQCLTWDTAKSKLWFHVYNYHLEGVPAELDLEKVVQYLNWIGGE